MSMVSVKGVFKSYVSGGEQTKVLTGLDLMAEKGEMVMIMGPSGSGKTTLLNLLGGIDKPDSGTIVVAGQDITAMGPRELSAYRREHVGFIFQFYNLIPTLTAQENVELGIEATLGLGKETSERAVRYLDMVGLADKKNSFPQELSGGEQQRVAIARALAKEPRLVLADEPTGNLDEEREVGIMSMMKTLQKRAGITFFIVSHNERLRKYMDRTLYIRRGKLEEWPKAG